MRSVAGDFAQQRAEVAGDGVEPSQVCRPTHTKGFARVKRLTSKNQEGGYSIKKLNETKNSNQVRFREPAKRQKIREALGSVQEQSDEEPKADEISQ
ncbi:hypothetical protein Tco_0200003 [Tanacetum coccineum]